MSSLSYARNRFAITATTIAPIALLSACSTYRGELKRAAFTRNNYFVVSSQHHVRATMRAPDGWKLEPNGAPCYAGSLENPKFPGSLLVLQMVDSPDMTRRESQADLHDAGRRRWRKEEPNRIEFSKKFVRGIPSQFRTIANQAVPGRDPLFVTRIKTLSITDGRKIWICNHASKFSGRSLVAMIPENSFYVSFSLNTDFQKTTDELMSAFEHALKSCRLEML